MAEPSTTKAPAKRRRILDASAIVPVPVYSNQVNKSLQLSAPAPSDNKPKEVDADPDFWSKFSCDIKKIPTIDLSDSDDDPEPKSLEPQNDNCDTDVLRSPSPPPDNPVQKTSRKTKIKVNEIERRLKVVKSLLSPVDESQPQRRSRRSSRQRSVANDVIMVPAEDDDVIFLSSDPSPVGSGLRPERQIPLKVRCRADLHKILVLPSTPLSAVVEQLSVTLGVPPPRLLLLREEAELNLDATVQALGLGIADIIECAVMADDEGTTDTAAKAGPSHDIITVRLQGKDRASTQEFSLHQDAPLDSVFAQYLSSLPGGTHSKVRFHFDGSKVTRQQTPAQLDMEDGDIIEVWT